MSFSIKNHHEVFIFYWVNFIKIVFKCMSQLILNSFCDTILSEKLFTKNIHYSIVIIYIKLVVWQIFFQNYDEKYSLKKVINMIGNMS